MPALIFIAISWIFGYMLISVSTGGITCWSKSLFRKNKISAEQRWYLTAFAAAAASLWVGLFLTSWTVYLIAWLADHFLPDTSRLHPLLPANLMILPVFAAAVYFYLRSTSIRTVGLAKINIIRSKSLKIWQSHNRAASIFTIASILFFLVFSCWLMFSSFGSDKEYVSAGYTVFSDFAPHTAMVSSFSAGRNWPTMYPHFAGDGISYHFMFFFLCGNLNWLGLPLGLAVNLPSILGIFCTLILLGVLAAALTGRLAVFTLAPLLTLARSSMAFFTWFGNLYKEHGGKWSRIITFMKTQRDFIGSTPRDDWGLWTINVYANQRHLMPALALMIFIIMLFLPQLSTQKTIRSIVDKNYWVRYNGTSPKSMFLASLLLFLFAYWHGSVLISTLSVLAIMAIFSKARIYYLMAALAAAAGALLQLDFFTSENSGGISASFLWGFIAEDKSLIGITTYLLELTGPLIPLSLLLLILPGKRRRVMLTAAFMPLIIAFSLSLTPDVTVNHKYIMITQMLLNIWLAELVVTLMALNSVIKTKDISPSLKGIYNKFVNLLRRVLPRLAAVLISILLMITGLMEWRIFANANNGSYKIRKKTVVTDWVLQETAPDAVFITAPWHYHSFFLTGRNVWLGHSYYAWSAGHATGTRADEQQDLLSGKLSVSDVYAYAQKNNIDYLLIDDEMRSHEQFTPDEDYFIDNFSTAAIFDDENHTIIYNLSK